jgi:RNA polymerase sigma factor (sigma-70 family)
VTARQGAPGVEPPDFDALFVAHAGRITRLAALLGAADPEDLAQEAFCRLLQAKARLDGSPERTVAYLNRIVVNEVRSRARRDQTARRSAHLLPVPRALSGDGGDRQAVIEELSRLPLRQREAIVLRFWLDLSLADVAAAMGVRLGTAKSQVSRGLAALALALADEEQS